MRWMLFLIIQVLLAANGFARDPEALVKFSDGQTIELWNVTILTQRATAEMETAYPAGILKMRQGAIEHWIPFSEIRSLSIRRSNVLLPNELEGSIFDCDEASIRMKNGESRTGVINVEGSCTQPLEPIFAILEGQLALTGTRVKQRWLFRDLTKVEFNGESCMVEMVLDGVRKPVRIDPCRWAQTPPAGLIKGAGLNGKVAFTLDGRVVDIEVSKIAEFHKIPNWLDGIEIRMKNGQISKASLGELSGLMIVGLNANRELVVASPVASRRQRLVGIKFPGMVTPVEICSDEDAVIHREGWIIGRVKDGVPLQLFLTSGKHKLEIVPVNAGLNSQIIEVDPAVTKTVQVTMRSDIIPAVKMMGAMPPYLETARRNGVKGEVRLRVHILADGSVGDIDLIEGLGHGLDELAIQSVRKWRFRSAFYNGQPIDSRQEISIPFHP